MSGTEDRLRPGVQPETRAAAEVEIVDERDKNWGRALTNDVVDSATANTTGTLWVMLLQDATTRRLGELHRLLNSRKGSLSATYKKNAEAKVNQETIEESGPEQERELEVCNQKRTQGHIIDACVSKSSGPRREIVGIVSLRLNVSPSLCTCDLRRTCICTSCLPAFALHGYCDENLEACGATCTSHFGSRKGRSSDKYNLLLFATSRYTRDSGQASSWFHKGWDGASGPLAVIKRTVIVETAAMSGTKVHREDRLRPWCNPRPGPRQ